MLYILDLCDMTHGLLPAYVQFSASYTNQMSEAEIQMHVPPHPKNIYKYIKTRPHNSCCKEESHLPLNLSKDFNTNRFLDMCKYHNADLFYKVVEGMRGGDCV